MHSSPEATLLPDSTPRKCGRRPSTRGTTTAALLALAGLVAGYEYFRYLQRHRPPDFIQFYLAGRMVVSGHIAHIYDKQSYAPLINQILREGARPLKFGNYYFNRPSFQSLYYAPLALFSYPTASDLDVFLNFIWLALLVWKLPIWYQVHHQLRPMIRCGLLCFYPFHWTIISGHDTLLLALLVAYALRLAKRGRHVLAGLLMALCFCKPHLMWAYPLVWVVQRRWRAAGAFLAAGTALALLSFLAVGWPGFREWIALLRAPTTDIAPDLMGNIRAVALHFGTPAGLIAGAVVIACLGLGLWKGSCYRRIASASLAPILLSPHTYWQDYSLVAMPIAMTPNPAAQMLLLVPWQFFYTRVDELPMVFIALGWLVIIAAIPLRHKTKTQRDTGT